MGLDINSTKFLIYAKSLNVDFTKTAMIGRQRLRLRPYDLRKNLRQSALPFDEEAINSIFLGSNGYAEEFLRYLGASEVHSFDYSSYEGATHIHDMNEPIPHDLKFRYSVVLDGGSLEHVFNFPVAIKNCMEMLQVGGHYLGVTPANNFMGHGFYQFSPELFFSVFSEENGYELTSLIVFEDKYNAKWFSVNNPKKINTRVTLMNDIPTYLLILAKRISEGSIFKNMPQQSDYVSTWKDSSDHKELSQSSPIKMSLENFLKRHVPTPVKKRIWRLTHHLRPKFNRKFFETVKWPNNTG